MNPLLNRSQRKLDEAAFFLSQLQNSQGRHPEFAYYLSAYLSAIRSVGWVLQSDLRGRFGVNFDNWWKKAKASLPILRVPFSVIVELRNQALKQGELLPGMAVVAKLKHPTVEEVTFTLNLKKGKIVVDREEYKFRDNAGPPLQLANLNDDGEVFRALDQAMPMLREVFRSLNEGEPAFKIASLEYLLESEGSGVPFGELVTGFSEHVEAMRHILNQADGMFSST